MTHVIHPLTPERWPDFETLFGRHGACYGCWCMYFRLPPAFRRETGGESKKAMIRSRILDGPPPGLLAYDGDRPVGWMQIGPRSDIPEWNNARRGSAPPDRADAADPAAWAISCFFVARDSRGSGLTHRLVGAGIEHARRAGARVIDACPITQSNDTSSVGLFVGSARVFEKAGFVEIARRSKMRPLMRLLLE